MSPSFSKTIFSFSLAVLVGAIPAVGAAQSFDAGSSIAAQGLLITAFWVFLGGVLVSVTPCVYPMIPITLSTIGARNAGSGFWVGFSRSFVFVAGIVVVYTALGLTAALTGGSISRWLGLWWVWATMSALFAAMGLAMMGFFTLELPPALAGKLQGKVAGKQGYVGAFLLGLVTGIIASPCGSPVLASVLLLAATKGQAMVGGFLLMAYALGIGLLFLVLGTFPALLTKLPKSGGWMEDVKKLLGAVLIGISLYYLQFARLPDAVYWPLVLGVALSGAFIVALRAGLRIESRWRYNTWRATAAGLALFSVYVAVAKVPAAVMTPSKISMESQVSPGQALRLALQNSETTGTESDQITVAAEAVRGVWLNSEEDGLIAARQLGLPLMIDFRADWCAACIELERKTFPEDRVAAALAEGFVKVKIDATESTPEIEALQQKYRAISLPTVAFVDTAGRIRHEHTLYTFESPELFLRRLEAVRAIQP